MAKKKPTHKININRNQGSIGDVFGGDKVAGDKIVQNNITQTKEDEGLNLLSMVLLGGLAVLVLGGIIYFVFGAASKGLGLVNKRTNEFMVQQLGIDAYGDFLVARYTDEDAFFSLSYPSFFQPKVSQITDSSRWGKTALFMNQEKDLYFSFIRVDIKELPWKEWNSNQWKKVRELYLKKAESQLPKRILDSDDAQVIQINQHIGPSKVWLEYKVEAKLGTVEKKILSEEILETLDQYKGYYMEFQEGVYVEAEFYLPFSVVDTMKKQGVEGFDLTFNYQNIKEGLRYSYFQQHLTAKENQIMRDAKANKADFTAEELADMRATLANTEKELANDPRVFARLAVLVQGYKLLKEYETCRFWVGEFRKHNSKSNLINSIKEELDQLLAQ